MAFSDDQQNTLEAIGRQIGTIRRLKRLRQKTVAKNSGISASSYNQIEQGKRNVTIITLCKIATALDVPLHLLVRQDLELTVFANL